ncbi:PhoD-like phosphatase N-terminal domain-containing protein [Actinoplanes sp. NPDC024001]|uniref:PhoD-like phosphatase N-terminal domain-containing protein n=1 Tax=Actinoplanes sp. NPDC024001 TaxID=3154598 RepID=UPI0033D8A545
MPISRRTLLLSSAAAGAAGASTIWPLAAQAAPYRGPLTSDPFTLGVASGDPDADGFVLWTRLAPPPRSPRTAWAECRPATSG